MAIDAGLGDRGGISQEAVDAFALIVAGDDPTERMPEAVAELETLGVVVRDLRATNRPVPLDPGGVFHRRLERELRSAEDCIARMRSLSPFSEALSEVFERSRLHAGGRSEFIPDPVVVNARLTDVVGGAQFEILAAQPNGPRTPEQLDGARGRDVGALDRGVAMRTLYRASVRDNSVTGEYTRAMANRSCGRSAEFRTMPEPFARCIVVDRRVAFISNTVVAGAHENAAWQITDGAFVAYIVDEFESRWRRADPWHGVRGHGLDAVPAVGVRTTRRQREILRELAADLPQPTIAQRLGISLRTLQAEIAELKSLFDVVSVPALTYKWALSPDRQVNDSASEDGLTAATGEAA